MIAIKEKRIVRSNKLVIDIPKELENKEIEIIILSEEKFNNDFSDLVGKLEWSGNPVEEQRKLRDEW